MSEHTQTVTGVSPLDPAALASTHLSRYDALVGVSKTLATHQTIGELFKVLGQHLHPLIPFDYLALLLHDEPKAELRLVVLEPPDFVVPFGSKPIADHGPAARVWETQRGAVIPIPAEGPLPEALDVIREHGYRMTCFLPLTTAHRKVGVLAFGSRSAIAYTEDVLAFMEQVAAIVAIAVENGINREDAERYEGSFARSGMACGSFSMSATCSCRTSITNCSKPSVARSSASSLPITSAWPCTTRRRSSSGST